MKKSWDFPHIKEKPLPNGLIARFRSDGSLFGIRCGSCDGFWKIYQNRCHTEGCTLAAKERVERESAAVAGESRNGKKKPAKKKKWTNS